MTSRRQQVSLQPGVLTWARQRAGISRDDLARKMQVKVERVVEWEQTGTISVAQVDKLANRTHTPLGYLYLSEPPEEELPIPDFRTRRAGSPLPRPSPNLLETVYAMQRRQAWMREDLITYYEEPPLSFVGAFALTDDPAEVARAMREELDIVEGWAASAPSLSLALRHLRDKSADAGILVVFNGVVGNNTSRTLDSQEFQGFALVDEHAPLVFVNNADFKAAQMFTLAHELAHVFVGQTGLTHFEDMRPADHETELFCDKAAAEFLVPELDLRAFWDSTARTETPYERIAAEFKVSSLVAARRALDLELIERDAFFVFYNDSKRRVAFEKQLSTGGGDFWNNQMWRVGTRFATAVYRAVMDGRLTYTEAYSLTDLRGETFENMAVKMEIPQ